MPIAAVDLEQLRAQLASWMALRLQEDASSPILDLQVTAPESPSVGQSNETLAFTATWIEGSEHKRGSYVVRRQPSTSALLRAPDVRREFEVLRGLAGSGVPVPRVRWMENDPAVQGVPFFVMDRVAGTVPSGKPSIHAVGWLTTLEPAQRARLAYAGLDALIALHAHDWSATHAFLLGAEPAPSLLTAYLTRLKTWYDWVTGGRAFPVTDAAFDWLFAHLPQVRQNDPVLLWGDARLGNIIFSDTLDVAAVIDWEFASLGPPELDVAYWITFEEFLTEGSGFRRLDGVPGRDEVVSYYQERTGRELHDLPYYEVITTLFTAITVIRQADIAVEQGRLGRDTTMGHGNAFTQMLAQRLALPVPELSEDFLRHRQVRTETTGGNR